MLTTVSDDRIEGAKAIAEALGVRPETVYMWAYRKRAPLTLYKRLDGRLFVRRQDVDRALASTGRVVASRRSA
jgi:hypothetical protein